MRRTDRDQRLLSNRKTFLKTILVMGENALKVLAGYDNESGFSNRLVDTAQLLCNLYNER